jgi:type IV pilus assembly protein PilM
LEIQVFRTKVKDVAGMLTADPMAVVGLDVGFTTVKMIQLSRNGGYTVTGGAIVNIEAPAGAEAAAREAATAAAIARCHKALGARTRYTVCGVSGPEVAARSFSFAEVAPERLEAAVLAEAADVCPFNVRQGRFDYQVVPLAAGEKTTCGIMVAATNAVVEARRIVVEKAGLRCVLMDVEGLAIINLFNQIETIKPGRTLALLNVAGNSAVMAILGESGLPFIRDFNHGGDVIVSQIAEERGLTPEMVRSALTGKADNDDLKHLVAEGMKNACNRIVKDISETLRYHMTQEKGAAPEVLYVCGGFSQAEGFVSTLSSQLNLEGRKWNPFEKMKIAENARGRELILANGPAFVVAAGLAMRRL